MKKIIDKIKIKAKELGPVNIILDIIIGILIIVVIILAVRAFV